jgi:hypothetical protein
MAPAGWPPSDAPASGRSNPPQSRCTPRTRASVAMKGVIFFSHWIIDRLDPSLQERGARSTIGLSALERSETGVATRACDPGRLGDIRAPQTQIVVMRGVQYSKLVPFTRLCQRTW